MKRHSLRFAISSLVSGLILVSVAAIATVLYVETRRALFLTTSEMMGQISHAMSDNVNLASRLEGLNKFYGTRILLSEATLRAAGDTVLVRKVDLVAVKGRQNAIAIFELMAMRKDATDEALAEAAAFNAAFANYENRRWKEALQALEAMPLEPDGPRRILLERCRHCLASPPGPEWDGVFRHQEK